jgi:Xaa-Pro aminopeptidase
MHLTLFRSESALYHVCGYACDNAIAVCSDMACYFVTDGRYVTDAKANTTSSTQVVDGGKALIDTVRKLLRRLGATSVTLDPKEWNVLEHDALTKTLPLRWKPVSNLSQRQRLIKTPDALDRLRQAAQKGAKAFDAFVAFVKEEGVGLSERALQFEAQRIFTCNGALGLSFSPIIALNHNAAKPHALPEETRLSAGDLLLIDAGVVDAHYCSDRTRTLEVGPLMHAGKAQRFTCKTRQKVYDLVLRAQEAAIQAVKPGVRACEVDAAARTVIQAGGYGDYFVHSTGHGVGLDIHELPVIGASSQTVLECGMVFTIEPGIYLPGEFGVRIEDMVVVREDGAEVL